VLIGVLAVLLTVVALPPLAARAAGGRPPGPRPALAALAPAAVVPAVAAVALAATEAWWLAAVLAVPAAVLVYWQRPVPRRGVPRAVVANITPTPDGSSRTLRMLSLNAQAGSADPARLVAEVHRHRADVLAVQELTPELAAGLTAAGLDEVLPHARIDPRPGSPGTGLWTREPLTALPPVPGMHAATPRARISLPGGPAVTLAAVHPIAPVAGHAEQWARELGVLAGLARDGGPQVLAGDFNASRDHQPFRELLAAGFLDCADAARRRPWPGFTWPVARWIPALMRLDHVLASGPGASVSETAVIRVPGTDHCGLVAVITFTG